MMLRTKWFSENDEVVQFINVNKIQRDQIQCIIYNSMSNPCKDRFVLFWWA